MRQKDKNIRAELAGGVKKQYQPVGVTLLEQSIQNRYTTLNQDSQIASAKSPEGRGGDSTQNPMMNIVSDDDSLQQYGESFPEPIFMQKKIAKKPDNVKQMSIIREDNTALTGENGTAIQNTDFKTQQDGLDALRQATNADVYVEDIHQGPPQQIFDARLKTSQNEDEISPLYDSMDSTRIRANKRNAMIQQ